jgi:hypothetical protein
VHERRESKRNSLRNTLKSNAGPIVFAALAVILAAMAGVLQFHNFEASDTTEIVGPLTITTTPTIIVTPTVISTATVVAKPAPSSSSVTVTPTVTAKPTITMRPTVPVTATASPEASPSAAATVTSTVVKGKASDTLELGLLGLAAFFALIAGFYSHIQSITGPGGFAVVLTSDDGKAASKAVTDNINSQVARIAPPNTPDEDLPTDAEDPPARLAIMARRAGREDAVTVLKVTRDATQIAAQATAITLQYAQDMLSVAKKKPAEFPAYADGIGIPLNERATVLAGKIPDVVWNKLAERALGEVNQSGGS